MSLAMATCLFCNAGREHLVASTKFVWLEWKAQIVLQEKREKSEKSGEIFFQQTKKSKGSNFVKKFFCRRKTIKGKQN